MEAPRSRQLPPKWCAGTNGGSRRHCNANAQPHNRTAGCKETVNGARVWKCCHGRTRQRQGTSRERCAAQQCGRPTQTETCVGVCEGAWKTVRHGFGVPADWQRAGQPQRREATEPGIQRQHKTPHHNTQEHRGHHARMKTHEHGIPPPQLNEKCNVVTLDRSQTSEPIITCTVLCCAPPPPPPPPVTDDPARVRFAPPIMAKL